MVFTLSAALLAGFGADWLASHTFDARRARPGRLRAPAGLPWRLLAWARWPSLRCSLLARGWLSLDPDGTRRAIEAYYLSPGAVTGRLSDRRSTSACFARSISAIRGPSAACC